MILLELEFKAIDSNGKEFNFKLNDSIVNYKSMREHVSESICIDAIEKLKKESKKKCIVGSSGAGKSTFIKLLLREELPTFGEIEVNGKDVVHMSQSEVPYLRRGLGVIFQDYRLLPDKTVFENVAFAMQVIEAPRKIMQKSVNSVLDIVGLSDRYKDFPDNLSGGEQQRVAIARAIVNDPAIVIADEPTGNLDPDTSWGIMQIFQRINDAGTTIVMATHDKAIVDGMKKRVIEIESGHVIRDQARGYY